MTKAPTVRVAELNPDCEGCMAAQRVIHMKTEGTALAIKKIRKQCDEICKLQEQNDKLIACLKRAYNVILAGEYWGEYLSACDDKCDYSFPSCEYCKKKYIAHG